MDSASYGRALIVGGGTMAIDHHLPRFFALLGVTHVDVYDIDPRRREVLVHRFRRNPRIMIIDQIANGVSYDLVLIATPPKFHCDFYLALESQARTFLIEKPIALNAKEAALIEAAAAQSGASVFVNLFRRTLGTFPLLKRFYGTERFGRLLNVTVAEGDVFGWRAASLGSFSKDLNGGGVLMGTGPHTLDLLVQVFDRLELTSACVDGTIGAVEANCTLRFLGDDDVPVTVILSRNRRLSNTATFEFESAVCAAAVRDNVIRVSHADGLKYMIHPNGASAVPMSFSDLNDAFYQKFLLVGDNSSVGPQQSTVVLRLIDDAYRHARPCKWGF